jgi:transcriptional regulator with XRE-family HTH domain
MAKTLGEVLRKARLEAGLSLRDLERVIRMPASQLSQIENGTRADPAFSTVVRIAKGLGISLDTLASRTGSAETNPASNLGAAKALADLESIKRTLLKSVTQIDKAMASITNRSTSNATRKRT